MPRSLRVALLAVVVTAALVGVGLAIGAGDDGDDPTEAGSTPAAPTTAPDVPLSEVDTLTTAITRTAFCDAVAPEAVEAALGVEPNDSVAYADGQPARVTGKVEDIAHEFGCGWTGGGGNARAWVFAPPVTRRAAKDLVESARSEDRCTPEPAGPDFGKPTLALVCENRRGLEASYRGLFGDAWLTCTVMGRLGRAEVLERADRWCVAVLTAARS